MTILTVVVPVFRVPQFLGVCLDSILTGAPPGVEVVAVDDASGDACGYLLDAYAARDDRVRVVHLPHNVGLGRARNAGLDQATGRYVWFVDSDDWLPPGSVAAVLDWLAQTRPDVLLVDHVRVRDGGWVQVDPSRAVLRERPTGVTHLRERPDLLRLQHTVWNRVIRRGLLDEIDLRFGDGWYEDVPFSYPVLLGAERIAVLDRVCYCYRLRDASITSTPSERHFEAFEQYERLFARLDVWPGPREELRPWLFEQMIEHYLVIVGNEGRVSPDRRPAFFRRMVEHYRRYLPVQGYSRPRGVNGVKHRFVGWDAYGMYAALRRAYRVGQRARSVAVRRDPAAPFANARLAGRGFRRYDRDRSDQPR